MSNKEIINISQDDFNFLLKNGKRISKILNFDFESLIYCSWGFVKETLPLLFEKNDFEKLFLLIFKDRGVNLFKYDLDNITLADAMSFVLWLIDEMKSIIQLESNYLHSTPDVKMMQAGINNLNKFGVLNTLDNLTKGDILNYNEIRKLPYNVVFDKQYMDVTKSDIERKLAKIK